MNKESILNYTMDNLMESRLQSKYEELLINKNNIQKALCLIRITGLLPNENIIQKAYKQQIQNGIDENENIDWNYRELWHGRPWDCAGGGEPVVWYKKDIENYKEGLRSSIACGRDDWKKSIENIQLLRELTNVEPSKEIIYEAIQMYISKKWKLDKLSDALGLHVGTLLTYLSEGRKDSKIEKILDNPSEFEEISRKLKSIIEDEK
ncbi:MAG: hypothetical protein GON13_03455 [Nanoarchaeota archaeon]|nr:hypothetical protein [Nanoarchaeota archaeon]